MKQANNNITTTTTTTPASVWVINALWTDGDGFDNSDAWVYGNYDAAVHAMNQKWSEELNYWRNEKAIPITDEMAAKDGYWRYNSNEELEPCDEGYNANLILEHRDTYFYLYSSDDYARVEFVLIERKINY